MVPALGVGRVLITVYGVFAVAASARALYQIAVKFGQAPFAYALSALAAFVYVVATIFLARRGRRAYIVALVAVGVELVGVVTVGVMSVAYPGLFPRETVWSGFGHGYGFVPLVLPFLGLWWLYGQRGAWGAAQRGDAVRVGGRR